MHGGGKGISRRQFIHHGAALSAAATLAGGALPAMGIATRLTPVVATTEGRVRGLLDDGVHTFLGVPYAAPPIGKLRFQPPVPPPQRTAILDTIRYGRSAMQLSSGGSAVNYPGTVGPALGQIFGSREDLLRQGEDCLVLNIWSPGLRGDKRPVMVWFHGGGFNYGSGSWPAYDGHNLAARQDVVVVTVNHRLNVFGFLNLEDLGGAEYRLSGNAGQLDLVRSLVWIQENIANFGGDPDRVTVFGQSGGGAKCSTLLAMPAVSGMVHRAIIQSGAGLRSGDPDTATELALRVLGELGLSRDDLTRLREVPARDLLAAAVRARGRFGPIRDGDAIPHHPFDPVAAPTAAGIPVIVGCTKDERTLYNVGSDWWGHLSEEELREKASEAVGDKAEALIEAYEDLYPDYSRSYLYTAVATTRQFMDAMTLAERKIEQDAGAAYLYVFNWEAPVEGGILRAPHTMEIPFVFDNVDKGPILLGTDRTTTKLASQVSEMWATFARTGDPNTDTRGMPEWPPYDEETRPTMVIDTRSKVIEDHMEDVRKIMRG